MWTYYEALTTLQDSFASYKKETPESNFAAEYMLKDRFMFFLNFSKKFMRCLLNQSWFYLYYALINRARGPYEEIFVLTFKAYGPNAVRSMRLECQNKYFLYGPISRLNQIFHLECQIKYFLYGPKSRLIRALLYTYTNKIVYDEILLS